jgi:hypothetical protein
MLGISTLSLIIYLQLWHSTIMAAPLAQVDYSGANALEVQNTAHSHDRLVLSLEQHLMAASSLIALLQAAATEFLTNPFFINSYSLIAHHPSFSFTNNSSLL